MPLPKYFNPTKRTEYIFSAVLVISLLISLLNFPLSQFMSPSMDPDADIKFSVGWPWVFFEISTAHPDAMPVKFVELIISFGLFFLIAYILDVIISYISYRYFKSQEEYQTLKKREATYDAGKKAFAYYRKQGKTEEEIKNLFKQKGWSEEDIKKISL